MTHKKQGLNIIFAPRMHAVLACFFIAVASLCFPFPAGADLALLRASIIAYNLGQNEKSLTSGTYRGEEGILRLSPEVGRSFGLTVHLDQDYLEAGKEFSLADKLNKDTLRAMKSRKKEKSPGEHVRKIAESALLHISVLESARKRLRNYRSGLNKEVDERLDHDICNAMLERLLEESLAMASYNLREALGYFKNICQGLDIYSSPLKPGNIRFVNYVFSEFMEKAADDDKELFDLDRHDRISHADRKWKRAIEGRGARYVSIMDPLLEENIKSAYPVDPLLFFALMRQESGFAPKSVSPAGAVGLTQIMPRTAKDLGMMNVFMPPYLDEARAFLRRERSLRREAVALIQEINAETKLEIAKRARDLMQESLDYQDKRKKLYARYKRELLRNGTDDRLDPRMIIEYGFKYFSSMMVSYGGDISLALAAYNAGPQRVRKFNGIPPYAETVAFRNRVIGYYRDYLGKLKE